MAVARGVGEAPPETNQPRAPPGSGGGGGGGGSGGGRGGGGGVGAGRRCTGLVRIVPCPLKVY